MAITKFTNVWSYLICVEKDDVSCGGNQSWQISVSCIVWRWSVMTRHYWNLLS